MASEVPHKVQNAYYYVINNGERRISIEVFIKYIFYCNIKLCTIIYGSIERYHIIKNEVSNTNNNNNNYNYIIIRKKMYTI